MEDKELMAEAMEMAEQLDLGRLGIRWHYRETIRRLVERVEELTADFPAPKSIVWETKDCGEYWYIDDPGHACMCFWDDYSIDLNRLKHHNVYKTQGQAEKAASLQQRYNMVLQAVLNLEPDQKVDWKDKDQAKYVVAFDHIAGVWFYWGRCVLDNLYPVLTDKKNVQPLLDYLNSKEKGDD